MHVIDTGLDIQTASANLKTRFNIMRRLCLELEILRDGRKWKRGLRERRSCDNALVDVRRAESWSGASEDREVLVEAVLKSDMQRVIGFLLVERSCLGDDA